MKVQFTRTLHIGKEYYREGELDLPESLLKQPAFAKHVKCGHIIDVGSKPKKIVQLSEQERAQALLEKLHGKQVASSDAVADDQAQAKGKKK
jgi:hypothetical protein